MTSSAAQKSAVQFPDETMGPNRSLLDRDMARAKAQQVMPEVLVTTREIVTRPTRSCASSG